MSIKNFDLIRGKIRRVKDSIQSGGLFRFAVTKWAQENYLPYARQIAPVRTGSFRDSINVDVQFNQASIIAPVLHANFVEYGTRFRAAQPTLRPALNATRSQLSAQVRKAVRDLLK